MVQGRAEGISTRSARRSAVEVRAQAWVRVRVVLEVLVGQRLLGVDDVVQVGVHQL